MSELVSVVVGGLRWTAFEEVTVHAAVKHAARSFSLRIAAEAGAVETAAIFQTFAPIQIFAGANVIFTGYIDERAARLTPERGEITVSGRAKGADAIDSSAIHPTGRFDNKSPLDIAKDLDKFGVGFTASAPLETLAEYQLTPGETVWRTLERLARDQSCTLRGMPDGSIDFWNASSTPARHAGALIEGKNIEEIHASHNAHNRHSHVHVRGQKYDGHGPENTQIESVATDDAVPRYRPQVVVADGDIDKDRANKKAEHLRNRKAGAGLQCSIIVPTWRDDAGAIWTPGNRMFIQSPFAALSQDMILESVAFEQTMARTVAKLGFVDPRAYAGAKGKVNKSGSGWSQGDTPAKTSFPDDAPTFVTN